jgi:hypothetical protein
VLAKSAPTSPYCVLRSYSNDYGKKSSNIIFYDAEKSNDLSVMLSLERSALAHFPANTNLNNINIIVAFK